MFAYFVKSVTERVFSEGSLLAQTEHQDGTVASG